MFMWEAILSASMHDTLPAMLLFDSSKVGENSTRSYFIKRSSRAADYRVHGSGDRAQNTGD
jgi:hypothetical protein